MPEEHPGPLASGWQSLRERLAANKKRTTVEIAMYRLAFYCGARHAIRTAAHSAMALPLMAIEVREFERELKAFLEEKRATECQPVNIS
jgi:hypothetical protein